MYRHHASLVNMQARIPKYLKSSQPMWNSRVPNRTTVQCKCISRRPRIQHKSEVGLPVFGNVEGPLESEMSLLVIVDEGRDRGVVATGNHSGRCIFFGD